MHIILGILGSIITILWLLHRLAEMGVTLGGLNPFLWHRRRKWRKHHDANPIFKINSPLEATALVLAAIAKADGDMSLEEKNELLAIFEKEFHLSAEDAKSLLISSTHLLGKGDEVRDNTGAVFKPSLESFTEEQANSAIELFNRIASFAEPPSDAQQKLVNNATAVLARVIQAKPKWA